jgi:uncharacterized membrane protein YqjE
MPASEEARHPPWVQSLQELAAAMPGLFSDRLELLALELHRAGGGVLQIVTLVLLAAILGVTAWMALWVGIALELVALGLPSPLAALAVLLVNMLLAWVATMRIHRLVAALGLPATRRHLAFGAGAEAVVGARLPPRPLNTTPEGRP